MDILSSDRTELKYTQQKLNIDVKGWIGIGLNSGGNKKKDTKDLNKMCYPMTWVALTYGVSPLKPHTDGCTLKVVGKTGTLELGKEMSNRSICHKGEGMRRKMGMGTNVHVLSLMKMR